MKKKFSIKWKASKQPRKQRKFLANAPIHIKRKKLSVNLSKDLRKKHERRNVVVRKGDSVLIMRGKFKGKRGKVLSVKIKMNAVYVEGIQVKKRDGSKSNVRLQPSNLQIVELNLDDKKRLKKKIETTKKQEKKQTKVKESSKQALASPSKNGERKKK